MASNYTENYGLCQWEATDAVLRTDFNEDNQKIDTALKNQAGSISDLTAQMANKANTGSVNSLAEEVALKADQSDLEAAVSRVTTLENKHSSDVAALRSENCWVKLSDETLSGLSATYSYSIQNAGQYAELKCIYSMATSNGRVDLSVNDGALIYTSSGGSEYTNLATSASEGLGGVICIFPICMDQSIAIDCKTVGFGDSNKFVSPSKTIGLRNVSLDQLRSIMLFADGGNLEGGRFILYGMKK